MGDLIKYGYGYVHIDNVPRGHTLTTYLATNMGGKGVPQKKLQHYITAV